MKSKLVLTSLICIAAGLARADFNPVPLTPGSYTFGIVVPSNTVQALPYCITATAGTGTSEGDNTYYEQGFYAPPHYPGANSGIPLHNTVFTNISNTNMTFLMPPTYLTNNDLMVYSGFGGGTFLFVTPTTATNLAILGADGSGGMTIGYTVTHQSGVTESGSFGGLDWFNGASGTTTVAWGANGRVTAAGGFNNYNSSTNNNNTPYLYAYKLTVSGTNPIVSITFNYLSGGAYGNFFAVSGNASGATWTPIPVTGFNLMTVVPAALPFPVTATMDNGTNLVALGNTWFEQGYYQANTSDGLPPSGSIFSSATQPTHHYQMGNYSALNAVLLDTNHLTANITPASPAPYTSFAFLTAGGNIGTGNKMTNEAIMQHMDGVMETNKFIGYDWFENTVPSAVAFAANGRVEMSGRTLNNLGNTYPQLFETYFTLSDTVSPVTNIILKNLSVPGASATTFIMAVSATAGGVPPVITQDPSPATQTWYPGQTATLSVQSSGTAPITNYWYVEDNGVFVQLMDGMDVNGSIISGSSTTTLTISDLALADGTNYEYAISNSLGGAVSATALITVNPGTPVAPIIDSQVPASSVTTITVLTNHPDVTTFSVTIDASSAPPLYYQWYSGLPQTPANAIPGAINATYANVDTNNGAILSCVISNFVGAVTSSPVAISVVAQPALVAYQSAIAAYNPVGFWPLSETNGDIAFDYVGTNDGVYMGGYTLGQTGFPDTAGIGANTSVAFDGVTGYVDIPVANLNITGPMSVIAFIQTPVGGEAGGHFGTVLGHSDQSYRMSVVGSTPRFTDAGPDGVGTANVGDGNWHQLVGVFDGTNQYIYADGLLTGSPVASRPLPGGSPDDVWIAAAPDYAGARNFTGNLAQVAILTNALTAAQVATLYYSLELPPTVSITPEFPSIYAGANYTFAAATNGTPPLSLQWYYIDTSNNSNNIAGATNATYTVSNATAALNGYTYGINVTNLYGTATASAVLTVQNGPPYLPTGGDISILNGEAYVGAPVTYSVSAAGSEPIFYQWMEDGTNVTGATNSSFTAPAGCGTNTYQVAITNSFSGGSPTLSSVATLLGESYPSNVTFNSSGTGWQLNTAGNGAVPSIVNNVLELTDGVGSEASSAFYDLAQYVGSFTASFTYTAGGNAAADGVAFIIQNSSEGTNALGAAGGDLGYFGITPSVALEINLYQIVGIAPSTNGLTYGTTPQGLPYGPTGNVFVNSTDPINFQLNFANGILAVTLTDTMTTATYSTNYTFGSLTELLDGTDLAYIGFSGGDGGATSIQTISNFVFTPVIPSESLVVSSVTASSFVLSWPAVDPNFVLQQSPDLLNWSPGPAPTVVGSVNEVTVSIPSGSGHSFYRLARNVCP